MGNINYIVNLRQIILVVYNMDHETERIISEWEFRIKQIELFNTPEMLSYGNVNVAIDRYRSFVVFIRYYTPILRKWMNQYLVDHRKHIFIKLCGSRLYNELLSPIDSTRHYVTDHYTTAHSEWDAIFGETPARFSIAHKAALALYNKIPIAECDTPSIREMHEGIDHENSWWGCDLCDMQVYQWKQELTRRFKESEHPLQNPTYRQHMQHTYAKELEQLGEWEPPHLWFDIDSYKSSLQTEYTTYVKSDTSGKTHFQQMKTLVSSVVRMCGLPDSKKDPYYRFFQLWNKLDLISFIIQLHLPDMIELEYT